MEAKSLNSIMSTGSRVNNAKKAKKKKLKKTMSLTFIGLVAFVLIAFMFKLIVDSIMLDRLERKILKDTPTYIRKELEPYMR